MKITKEEKSLYNFLNVFNAIFGKSQFKNTIIGRGNRCYFFTNGYIGIFEDKDRETLVGGNYDFGDKFYELKQTPSKTFELDEIEIEDNYYNETVKKNIGLANLYFASANFQMEYEKSYEYKLAKIAETTKRWLKDNDVKYLNCFKEATIFQDEDSIIIKSHGLTNGDFENVTTVLVFVGEIHPDMSDSTQQKIIDENNEIMEDDALPPKIDDLQDNFFNEDVISLMKMMGVVIFYDIRY